MAQARGGKPTVSMEDLVLAQSFETAALVNLLEREGVLAQVGILQEIKRIRAQAGKWTPQARAWSQQARASSHLVRKRVAGGTPAWRQRAGARVQSSGG